MRAANELMRRASRAPNKQNATRWKKRAKHTADRRARTRECKCPAAASVYDDYSRLNKKARFDSGAGFQAETRGNDARRGAARALHFDSLSALPLPPWHIVYLPQPSVFHLCTHALLLNARRARAGISMIHADEASLCEIDVTPRELRA